MVILTEPKVVISPEYCKSCSMCIQFCPAQVLELSQEFNQMGYHPARYTDSGCTGCGICYYACPEPKAITILRKGCTADDQSGTY